MADTALILAKNLSHNVSTRIEAAKMGFLVDFRPKMASISGDMQQWPFYE